MINGQKAYHIKVLWIVLTAFLIISIIAIAINFNQQTLAINNNQTTSMMTNQTGAAVNQSAMVMIPQEFIMNMSNETVMDAVEDDEEAMMALERLTNQTGAAANQSTVGAAMVMISRSDLETVMDAVEDDEEAMMALENTRENVTARPPITGVTNVIPPLLS